MRKNKRKEKSIVVSQNLIPLVVPPTFLSGSTPLCDSLESLVSYEVIWYHWVRRFPSNEGIKD